MARRDAIEFQRGLCIGVLRRPLFSDGMAWVFHWRHCWSPTFYSTRFFIRKCLDFPGAILCPAIAPNYIGYAAFIGLGVLLRSKRSCWTLMTGSFLGAIIFYIVSNTASWLTLAYAKTFFGWIQALTVGLPGSRQRGCFC